MREWASAKAIASDNVPGSGFAKRETSEVRHRSPSVYANLLHQQRRTGNRAVQRMIASSARHPIVQRWDTPEHVRLGNVTGLEFDLGQSASAESCRA